MYNISNLKSLFVLSLLRGSAEVIRDSSFIRLRSNLEAVGINTSVFRRLEKFFQSSILGPDPTGGRDGKSSGREAKGLFPFLKRGTPLHPLCGGAATARARTLSGDRWDLSRGTFPSTIDRVPAERVSSTRGYFQVRCTSSENSRGSGKPAAAGIARSFGKPNPAGSRHRETIERPLRTPARVRRPHPPPPLLRFAEEKIRRRGVTSSRGLAEYFPPFLGIARVNVYLIVTTQGGAYAS